MERRLGAIDERLVDLGDEMTIIRKEVQEVAGCVPRATEDLSALLGVMERIEDLLLRIETRLSARY